MGRGFKQRNVVDPSTRLYKESDEQFRHAKEAVKQTEWQGKTLEKTLTDAHIQLTKNEVYFLTEQSKMFKEIFALIGPGGPVQKEYVKWGESQAAKGAIEGNEQYDKEKEAEIDTVLDNENKLKGAASIVADRQDSNVKKGQLFGESNHWRVQGKARAIEARRAADFGLDVQNYLTNSDDELTYTDSAGNHIPFQVKNLSNITGTPKAHNVAVRHYAAKMISQAVEKGLSYDYVATKIVPLINKQASEIIKNHNIAWNIEDANNTISDTKDDLSDSFNLGLTPIPSTVQAARQVLYVQMKRKGEKDPWKAADKVLFDTMKSALTERHARGGDIQEQVDEFKKIKFKFPWLAKEETLPNALTETFGDAVLDKMVMDIENDYADLTEKNREVKAKNGVKNIDKMFLNGASDAEITEAELGWISKYGKDYPDLKKDLLDRSDLKMPTKQGFAYVNQIIKDEGKVDSSRLARVNSEALQMLKDKHGEDFSKWHESVAIGEQISQQGTKDAKSIIDGALNKVLQLATKDDATNDIVARVRLYVYDQLAIETRNQIDLAKDNGEDLSNNVDEAAKRAATKIATDITIANDNPTSTSLLRSTPTEGFKFFDDGVGTYAAETEQVAAGKLVSNVRFMLANNPEAKNILATKKLENIPESLFELTNADEVKPFWRELERMTGHDAKEIYKNQAAKYGINISDPKSWDGQDLIKEAIPEKTQSEIRKNPENTKASGRAIDSAGGISPVDLEKASEVLDTIGIKLAGGKEKWNQLVEDTKKVSTVKTRRIFIRQLGITAMGYAPNALDSDGVPLYRSLQKSSNGRTYASITAELQRHYFTGGLEI